MSFLDLFGITKRTKRLLDASREAMEESQEVLAEVKDVVVQVNGLIPEVQSVVAKFGVIADIALEDGDDRAASGGD